MSLQSSLQWTNSTWEEREGVARDRVVCVWSEQDSEGGSGGWKQASVKTVIADRRQGGKKREKKRDKAVVFNFLTFATYHECQFTDAVPLSLPNRVGESLGSAVNR